MTDFVVKITVKNGRLLRAIRAKYGTSAEMARRSGVSASTIAGLLTMKISPVSAAGDWSKSAFDVSSALLVEPESLWPSHIAKIRLNRNEAEIDMSLASLQEMIDGNAAIKAIALWAKTVNPRQMRALVGVSQGATLDEMAKEMGVSGERVRTLSAIAAGKIRNAALQKKSKGVEDFRI